MSGFKHLVIPEQLLLFSAGHEDLKQYDCIVKLCT